MDKLTRNRDRRRCTACLWCPTARCKPCSSQRSSLQACGLICWQPRSSKDMQLGLPVEAAQDLVLCQLAAVTPSIPQVHLYETVDGLPSDTTRMLHNLFESACMLTVQIFDGSDQAWLRFKGGVVMHTVLEHYHSRHSSAAAGRRAPLLQAPRD